ncbi:hypothetical protein MBLNU457_5876t2 [Dothideomycetes sp. NU457]
MLFKINHLLTGALAVCGANAASAVLDLLPSNFDDIVIKSGKPALVEFFAPWCGHCKNLAPIYEELAGSFESQKDKLVIGKVDADEHKELGRRFGIQGFPTLKWFDGKSAEPVDYNSGRDLESLQAFIADKTGMKPKKAKAPHSDVEMLTDTNFRDAVNGDKDVLVAFTAPWCGHCKSLAPTWEALAKTFSGEPSVVIAKMDADAPTGKKTANEQGVKSFPTIKYFPKGSSEAEAYSGARTEQAFVDFLNEKAGTHRMIGGLLDTTAGTIAALDELVKKYTGKSEGISSVAAEVKDAALQLQDKYAEYYVKVFDKLSANSGYVEKESKRLAGLVKKGGLAPEKLDDLMKRSNILNRFREAVGAEPKQEL